MSSQARVTVDAATAELWGRTDAAGFLRAWTTGEAPPDPQAEHTGNRLVEVPAPGRVVMEWTPGSTVANLAGDVHGGYLALVCDEAAGLAAASTGERFVPMLTLDLDITYLRPGLLGTTYRVEGEVLHAGRTRVVSECRILAPNGKLITTARGSFVPNAAFVAGVERARQDQPAS